VPVSVIAAAPTPFAADGRIDRAAARALVEYLLTPDEGLGLDGVLIAGTTGEFPALLDDERLALARIAVGVAGADRVILHVGSASAHQAAALARAAAAAGLTRLAAITPYYLLPDPDRLVDYYREVAAAAPAARMYAYLFPERTGHQTSAQTFGEIAALEGIVGAKLSGSASERVAEYAAAAPGSELLVGVDAAAAAAVAAGAAGSITALAAAFPVTAAALSAHLDAGTAQTADGKAAQIDIQRAADAISGVGDLKAVLSARGVMGPTTRMPVPLPDRVRTDRLQRLADELS